MLSISPLALSFGRIGLVRIWDWGNFMPTKPSTIHNYRAVLSLYLNIYIIFKCTVYRDRRQDVAQEMEGN